MKVSSRVFTVVLTAAISIAGSPRAVSAQATGGASTVVPVALPAGGGWQTLLSVAFLTPGPGPSYCAVTASADAVNPLGGPDNFYRFVPWVDNAVPAVAVAARYMRVVDFDGIAGVAPDPENITEVSSTGLFAIVQPGVHTVYWLAQSTVGSVGMVVMDSSMTIVCNPVLLGNSNPVVID